MSDKYIYRGRERELVEFVEFPDQPGSTSEHQLVDGYKTVAVDLHDHNVQRAVFLVPATYTTAQTQDYLDRTFTWLGGDIYHQDIYVCDDWSGDESGEFEFSDITVVQSAPTPERAS